jgi:hypothetical protein
MLDVGCWMLDVGCWMLDVGCWMLDVGCWMLDVGCWMLDVRSSRSSPSGARMISNGAVSGSPVSPAESSLKKTRWPITKAASESVPSSETSSTELLSKSNSAGIQPFQLRDGVALYGQHVTKNSQRNARKQMLCTMRRTGAASQPDGPEPPQQLAEPTSPLGGPVREDGRRKDPLRDSCKEASRSLRNIRLRRSQYGQEPIGAHYLSPPARALAVALMIASDVIVALLVASIPATPCRFKIFSGVSVSDE